MSPMTVGHHAAAPLIHAPQCLAVVTRRAWFPLVALCAALLLPMTRADAEASPSFQWRHKPRSGLGSGKWRAIVDDAAALRPLARREQVRRVSARLIASTDVLDDIGVRALPMPLPITTAPHRGDAKLGAAAEKRAGLT
jgi:hypothetical protein